MVLRGGRLRRSSRDSYLWARALALMLIAFASLPSHASTYTIGCLGQGSFMKSPARYEGTFMFGVSGSWWIEVDDSLWPDESDSTARFEYIWSAFFSENYDSTPGEEAWTARFDMPMLPARPAFEFDLTSPLGLVGGDGYIVVRIRDWDADGELSQGEKHDNLNMSGYFTLDPYSCTGDFAGNVGSVTMSSGNFRFVNPPQSNALQIIGHMQASLATGPSVSGVIVSQRPGSMLVDVIYDLYHAESLHMEISLAVSDDGGITFNHDCGELAGDAGADVPPGEGKAVTWNAGDDYAGHAGGSFVVRVTADDGEGRTASASRSHPELHESDAGATE